MTSDELYERGYAIPLYGMYSHSFRFKSEPLIVLPHGRVPVVEVDGWPVARIEDVREAANG